MCERRKEKENMLFPVVLSRIECTMNYLVLTGLEV